MRSWIKVVEMRFLPRLSRLSLRDRVRNLFIEEGLRVELPGMHPVQLFVEMFWAC